VRLKLVPIVFLKELLAVAHLGGARQIHRFGPGNFPVAVAVGRMVRRWAVRFSRAVALPDAVGAVRVAAGAIRHAEPEHLARPLGGQVVAEHFVGGLAVDDGHSRRVVVRFFHGTDGGLDGVLLAVGRLQHVEVEQRGIVRCVAGGEAADAGGVDRQWATVRIGLADVAQHFGPLFNLLAIVVRKVFHQVPGQIGFAGGAPNDG
jgi:hypothetical protein